MFKFGGCGWEFRVGIRGFRFFDSFLYGGGFLFNWVIREGIVKSAGVMKVFGDFLEGLVL